MSSEIEQHTNVFLRLMIGNGRAEGECFGDGGVKIRYLEVEVHHRTLSTILRRPDGALVVRRLLEDDVMAPSGAATTAVPGSSWTTAQPRSLE